MCGLFCALIQLPSQYLVVCKYEVVADPLQFGHYVLKLLYLPHSYFVLLLHTQIKLMYYTVISITLLLTECTEAESLNNKNLQLSKYLGSKMYFCKDGIIKIISIQLILH